MKFNENQQKPIDWQKIHRARLRYLMAEDARLSRQLERMIRDLAIVFEDPPAEVSPLRDGPLPDSGGPSFDASPPVRVGPGPGYTRDWWPAIRPRRPAGLYLLIISLWRSLRRLLRRRGAEGETRCDRTGPDMTSPDST